jgi:hypothetical protein
MIPYAILERSKTRNLKRKDHEWQELLSSTGQSNFLSPENQAKALEHEQEVQNIRKRAYTDLKLKIALGIDDLDFEFDGDFNEMKGEAEELQC